MPQLQALIFDLDGTLLDSTPDLRQALNATLQEHGRPPLGLEEVKHMTGDGMLPMLTRGFEATGGVPAGMSSYNYFQSFIAHYRGLKPDPAQIYPHVRGTLEKYGKAGIKLGICTNKQEASTLRLLDDLDLRRYFGFIAGGDTFQAHKPHPDHVNGVLEKLGAAAANSVMVGDGSNDVAAAHGAHVPCIVVTHGYGSNYGELSADRLIGGFEELPAALDALGFVGG